MPARCRSLRTPTNPSRYRAWAIARRAALLARRSPKSSNRVTKNSTASRAKNCASGIVLTGGSAKMEGAIELAEEVFHVPVRLGVPQHIKGLSDVVRNPIYSTGAGLLLYARDNALAGNRGKSISGNARTMAERMKNWFQGNF